MEIPKNLCNLWLKKNQKPMCSMCLCVSKKCLTVLKNIYVLVSGFCLNPDVFCNQSRDFIRRNGHTVVIQNGN